MSPTHKTKRESITQTEWNVRTDLAALYRLVASHGYDDLVFTHISARVPGPEGHFLINPYGLLFEEITASSLVKIDRDGTIVDDGDHGINNAGFVIHSAVHAAREDAQFVIHLHTDDGVAVSAQAEGLLPLNQRALFVLPTLGYHDYEGLAEDLDERERIAANLGTDRNKLLLRNHGTLALGATAGKAWLNIYSLERACTAQVRTLSAGRNGALLAPEVVQAYVRQQASRDNSTLAALAWAALLRKLDRDSPDYAR